MLMSQTPRTQVRRVVPAHLQIQPETIVELLTANPEGLRAGEMECMLDSDYVLNALYRMRNEGTATISEEGRWILTADVEAAAYERGVQAAEAITAKNATMNQARHRTVGAKFTAQVSAAVAADLHKALYWPVGRTAMAARVMDKLAADGVLSA